MEVDVHKVITTQFNVEMNPFIARFSKAKQFETVKTGGLWEIRVTEEDVFKRYADKLVSFRNEMLSRKPLDFDSFCEELGPLLQFYTSIENFIRFNAFTKDDQTVLMDYLLEPLSRFLDSLDKQFRTTYFRRKLISLRSQHELVIRVVNSSDLPIPEVDVLISYVPTPIQRQFLLKYSRSIFVDTLRTNESGSEKIKLPKGHYKIDVRKYGKTRFENLYEDKEVVFKVPAFPKKTIAYLIASIVAAICVILILVLFLTKSFPFDLIY